MSRPSDALDLNETDFQKLTNEGNTFLALHRFDTAAVIGALLRRLDELEARLEKTKCPHGYDLKLDGCGQCLEDAHAKAYAPISHEPGCSWLFHPTLECTCSRSKPKVATSPLVDKSRYYASRHYDDGRGDQHPCQRCGSDQWADVDYSGCSDCREPVEAEIDFSDVRTETPGRPSLPDFIPRHDPETCPLAIGKPRHCDCETSLDHMGELEEADIMEPGEWLDPAIAKELAERGIPLPNWTPSKKPDDSSALEKAIDAKVRVTHALREALICPDPKCYRTCVPGARACPSGHLLYGPL